LDLFSGNSGGGVIFYRQFVNSVANPTPQAIPESIALLQNYPNPFNPETRIYEINIPTDELNEFQTLTIFNLLGEKNSAMENS